MNNRAQTIIEYVALFCLVVAALLIMGYYLRNTFSGKFREAADSVGGGEVYRPNVAGVDKPTVVK